MWGLFTAVCIFSDGKNENNSTEETSATDVTDNSLKLTAAQEDGLPVIGNVFSLNAAMFECSDNMSNIVLTTEPLGNESRKAAATIKPTESNCEEMSQVKKLPRNENKEVVNTTISLGSESRGIAATSKPPASENKPTATTAKPHRNDSGELASARTPLRSDWRPLASDSLEMMFPAEPSECEDMDGIEEQTEAEIDGEVEKESYEILDVVYNESDAEEIAETMNETNDSVGKTTRNAPNDDCAPLPKIAKVFQSVTKHFLGDITRTRSDKIQETKRMAKKSTTDINKKRIKITSYPNGTRRIHVGTTYSRSRVPSQSTERVQTSRPAYVNGAANMNVTIMEYEPLPKKPNHNHVNSINNRPELASHSTERAESLQSTDANSDVDSMPSPANSDDDLIELIEIPEKMQMEMDTLFDTAGIIASSEADGVKQSADDADTDEDEYKDYRCNICLEQNANFLQLQTHLFTIHLLSYVCRDCHTTFDTRSQYESHMRASNAMGTCKEMLNTCRKYMTMLNPPIRESKISVSKSAREGAVICGQCSLKLPNMSQYCAHAQRHANKFICRICSRETCRTQRDMAAHLAGGIHRVEHVKKRRRQKFDEHGLYVRLELPAKCTDSY